MLIALIGAQGTGKTTLANALCHRLGSSWFLFPDYYRRISTLLGYERPRQAVLEDERITHITATALSASALAAELEWCLQLEGCNGLIDMGPMSVMAYNRYWMDKCEMPFSPYLMRLCKKVSDQIDLFIYLPTGVIPLVGDEMRIADSQFQLDIDLWVRNILKELTIPENKILHVNSMALNDRVDDVIRFLESA